MNTQLFQFQKIATLLQKNQTSTPKPAFQGYGFVFKPTIKKPALSKPAITA